MAIDRFRASLLLEPKCRRQVSPICSPTFITGFSEYFGSCITIDRRRPRNFCQSFSVQAIRSVLSKVIRRALTIPGRGIRPKIARPKVDFPDPDSPTMPNRSRPKVNVAFRTASVVPPLPEKLTFNSSTSSSFSVMLILDRTRRAIHLPTN